MRSFLRSNKNTRRTPRRDPVTPSVRAAVLKRDGGYCVAPRLGATTRCFGRPTLDHVRDAPMMGKRAPSDPAHLVAICEGHHLGSAWATSNRPALRRYLQDVADAA